MILLGIFTIISIFNVSKAFSFDDLSALFNNQIDESEHKYKDEAIKCNLISYNDSIFIQEKSCNHSTDIDDYM